MKHRKSSSKNSGSIGAIIIVSMIALLVVVAQTSKPKTKTEPIPLPVDLTLATSSGFSSSTTAADFLTRQAEKKEATTTGSSTTEITMSAADFAKLQKKSKTPTDEKTYSGQEAVDFIKTLPLETQKQILGAGK